MSLRALVVLRLLAADGQALAALGSPALEHQTSILCRHTNPKPVRFAAPTGVRLKRAYTLGHDLSGLRPHTPLTAMTRRGEACK